jgi:hypothetical protein
MHQLSSRHRTTSSCHQCCKRRVPVSHWYSHPPTPQLHLHHHFQQQQQRQYMSPLTVCASNNNAGGGREGFDTAAYDKQRLRLDQQVRRRLLPHGASALPCCSEDTWCGLLGEVDICVCIQLALGRCPKPTTFPVSAVVCIRVPLQLRTWLHYCCLCGRRHVRA